MLSLVTSCSQGLDQARDWSPGHGMDLEHVDDLTAFGGVLLLGFCKKAHCYAWQHRDTKAI